MKYTIEFELPNNIEDELKGSYVSWAIWGYSGIAKAKPVEEPKWIPVTERLPEEDGRYLVFRQKNGKIFIDGWMVGRGWLFFETIDAWMPLPEPYEEEGE